MCGHVYFEVDVGTEVHKSVLRLLERSFTEIFHAKGYRVKCLYVKYNNYGKYVGMDYKLGIRAPPEFVEPDPPQRACCVLQ